MPGSFTINGIEFCYTSTFTQLWNTSAIHWSAKASGSIWQPTPPAGFACFGSFCWASTDNPSGTVAVLCAAVPTASAGDNPPLAQANAFTNSPIWTDQSTGYQHGNGACWQIQAPTGYVALGTAFNTVSGNYTAPSPSDFLCVRQDLVAPIGVATQIWTDQGTGSTSGDLACYQVQPPSPASYPALRQGSIALSPGVFVANESYGNPPTGPYVLLLQPTVTVDVLAYAPPNPTQRGDDGPGRIKSAIYTVALPFTAVVDAVKPLSWKLDNPIYTLQRTTSFDFYTNVDNPTSEQVTKTLSWTSGITDTQSQSFTQTVGVQVSATVGFELSEQGIGESAKESASITASLSASLGYSSAQSCQALQSATTSTSYPVAANTYMVFYTKQSEVELIRQDGSDVAGSNGSGVLSFAGTEVFVGSCSIPTGSAASA